MDHEDDGTRMERIIRIRTDKIQKEKSVVNLYNPFNPCSIPTQRNR